ncbi:MAG: Usg family protein [Rhodospirillales bacterium]
MTELLNPKAYPEETKSEMELRLQGYRLCTAEITYHRPDVPVLLQTFLWQKLDLAPRFPVLRGFLDFWEKNLDGKLHSVRVAQAELLKPQDARWIEAPLVIN